MIGELQLLMNLNTDCLHTLSGAFQDESSEAIMSYKKIAFVKICNNEYVQVNEVNAASEMQ